MDVTIPSNIQLVISSITNIVYTPRHIKWPFISFMDIKFCLQQGSVTIVFKIPL